MPRKVKPEVSAIRQKQRAHAKRRFSQRFDLNLNRDRIREIERMIGTTRAIAVPSKDCHSNYLVGVEGRLIVVGYNQQTHRLVTALPDVCLEQLPPETVRLARLRLLSAEQDKVVADILAGKAQLLHRVGGAEFYQLEYEGQRLRIGYRPDRRVLVPYRSKREAGIGGAVFAVILPPPTAAIQALETLEVEPAVVEFCREQIRDQQSIFLWRPTKTVAFHQVEWEGNLMRVGYSSRRDVFFQYRDPPESMAELRSSLRLLEAPSTVREAVANLVRDGRAERVSIRTEDRASYKVEWEGDVYWFDYSLTAGRILPWFESRARSADQSGGQEPRLCSEESPELSIDP